MIFYCFSCFNFKGSNFEILSCALLPWKKGPTWLRWFMHVGNEQIPPPVMYIYIWMYLDDILRWWTGNPLKNGNAFFPDRKHGKPKISTIQASSAWGRTWPGRHLPPILVWWNDSLPFWKLRHLFLNVLKFGLFFWGGGGKPQHFPGWSCHDFDVHDMDRIRLRFGNPPKNIDELEKEVGKDKHLGMEGITLPETNISAIKVVLKMSFLFARWYMLVPWRVNDRIGRNDMEGSCVFCFWKLLVEALRLEEVDGDDFAGIVIAIEAVQRSMCFLINWIWMDMGYCWWWAKIWRAPWMYGLIIHHIIQGVYPSTRNHESASPWKMSFAFNGAIFRFHNCGQKIGIIHSWLPKGY